MELYFIIEPEIFQYDKQCHVAMVNRNFVPQKMKKNLKKTPHVSSTQVRQVLHEKGKEVANRKDFIG